MISWTFHLRWVYWGIGISFLFLLLTKRWPRFKNSCETFLERHYVLTIGLTCSIWFVIACLSKISQFYSFNLHSQDFWLFVDILEQMKKGGIFLTRFAPQGLGFVQHGAVHPMFSWSLALPLAWTIGSVNAALIFNPAFIAGAAFILGLLVEKKEDHVNSLLWVVAFLFSTQIGKILTYEVHPEVMYPFFAFLWLWAFGLGHGEVDSKKVHPILVLVATALGTGIKEDSFLVFGPWILWGLWTFKGPTRKLVFLSGLTLLSVSCFQIVASQNWISGLWGPSIWQGSPVMTHASVGIFDGLHWSKPTDALQILQKILQVNDGVLGIFRKWVEFQFSRPWLSLLIFAPWVIFSSLFWWVLTPLTFIYSLLEGPNHLWNYYSAPFLASFWWIAISSRYTPPIYLKNYLDNSIFKERVVWVFLCSTLLGSASPEIQCPSPRTTQIRHEVAEFLPCLSHSGIVSSNLLGLVPQNLVWSDRFPEHLNLGRIDFVLLTPQIDQYGFSSNAAKAIQEKLIQTSGWIEIGSNCKPTSPGIRRQDVLLFKNIKVIPILKLGKNPHSTAKY